MKPLGISLVLFLVASLAQAQSPTVQTEGGLRLNADERGNRLPDYSYCGYLASSQPIPNIATRLRVEPSGADDTELLNAAMKALVAQPVDAEGWHGALQMAPGTFHVNGSINLTDDRIVLRGSVDESGNLLTTIIATGKNRRTLMKLGKPRGPDKHVLVQRIGRAKESTLLGATEVTVELDAGQKLEVGQTIVLEIASTKDWIHALGMDGFPSDDGRGNWLDWKPGAYNQTVTRQIAAIDANKLTLDAPVLSELNIEQCPVDLYSCDLRDTTQVGIEHLRLISQSDRAVNPKDEEHAWDGIRVFATDAWVSHVECHNFVGSAVRISDQARRITVADCRSLEPVSEDAGWRRRSFVTAGQQTLFLRCHAEDGRHDFCVESLTPGPNAFVYCEATRAAQASGPVGSWCTGVLFDNVTVDGSCLRLDNLETEGQGLGWTSANCALWNCVAPKLIVRQPAIAYNWAVGVWGEVTGNGLWAHLNEFVSPDSLYEYQLGKRLGTQPAQKVLSPINSPTHQAKAIVFNTTWNKAPDGVAVSESTKAQWLTLQDGRFMLGHGTDNSQLKPLAGTRMQLSWWRGSVLPAKMAEFGPGLTRFVPGHDERFATDDMTDVVHLMQTKGHVAVDHHWGLWYDRRRDDHQMVRRINGDAWPPFYEHPWARSGIGTAYDGLSKYDLTRFNAWYFGRLAEFASLADQHGLVLIQHMYFQHNILEAGAHWAEFPWRPANCLQATGFPEPPTYQNRKRVFMAEDFYDVNHPVRRDLHRRYIHHCLNTLSPYHNVLFVLGEEFTGPAHFMRFWLESIGEWQRQNDRDVFVVLSATRDVQEETLRDNVLAELVDAIEIKYWWHTKDGQLYDPPGGDNLAPRQQLREWKGSKSRSAESVLRSVAELRSRYPDKAILTNFPETPAFP